MKDDELAFYFATAFEFDLPAFDAWTAKCKPAVRQRIAVLRARLLGAVAAGNEDAAEAWATLLGYVQRRNLQAEAVHPLATLGHEVEHKLPTRGRSGTVYMPKRPPAKTKARDKGVMEATAKGMSRSEIAKAFGISESTVSRIRRLNR